MSVQNYLGRITREGIVDARKHIQISDTAAKHLGELVPDVGEKYMNIILLEYKKEWYFTRISEACIKELTALGIYCDEKLKVEYHHGEKGQ